ncbi:MAG: hypothetical protein M3389_12275 [Actinomycetota bacterium]|nr:hypothetical protein [Actinomycetota bacterium]
MYRLFVLPGAHPSRSAILMLEHKGVAFRCIELIPGTHPFLARLAGFGTGGQVREVDGKRPRNLQMADRLATVPALAAGKERISSNHEIARFLEARHPDPPLFPADPEQRGAVEEAEHWANTTLQMQTRRLLAVAAVRDPEGFARLTGDGRMGHVLFRQEWARRVLVPRILRSTFVAGPSAEPRLLEELPTLLDRVDELIAEGVIGGERPNVADFMVAPCLAIILYRPDVRPFLEGRPALELVDRFLPEPGGAGDERLTGAVGAGRAT